MEIKSACKASFGVPDACGVYSDLIINYIEMIQFAHDKIDAIDQKIKAIMENVDTQITSITGIGLILGATILAEIGDISRFRSADKLAAFAGIDPTEMTAVIFAVLRDNKPYAPKLNPVIG